MKLFFFIFIIAIFYPLIFKFVPISGFKKILAELFGYGKFINLYEEHGYVYKKTVIIEPNNLICDKRTVITERIGEANGSI